MSILNIVSWVVGFCVGIYWFFNAIGPLLWIPYTLFKINRKEYNPAAIAFCLVAPVIWNVVFGVLYLLLSSYINKGFVGGFCFGCVMAIIKVASKEARKEFLSKLERMKM